MSTVGDSLDSPSCRKRCNSIAPLSRAERGASFLCCGRIVKIRPFCRASANIAKYFQGIYLSEEVGHVKPERIFFDACFAEISDFDPSAAIIMGDSLTSDIQGGINAGIRTCWFNPAKKGLPNDAPVPDFEIHSLAEFPTLLEKI